MRRKPDAPAPAAPGASRSWRLRVFFAALALFTLTTYGGVRSPDSEVVFRAAQSFADHLRLDVGGTLDEWDGFGLARARDGAQYPIFGPLESIALAPFVLVGRSVAAVWSGRWPLNPSLYVGGGLSAALYGAPLHDRPAHVLRLACASFNVVVAALCATVFFVLLVELSGSLAGALTGTLFFGAGSLLWPYSGTYFSELLAMLFVLPSFRELVPLVTAAHGARAPAAGRMAFAGVALGLAIAAHLTAALFLPFFLAVAWLQSRAGAQSNARRTVLPYALGVAAVLVLLGAYNFSRFGSPLETGRTATPGAAEEFGYGVQVGPWPGLYGLLLAPGKGLLLFSPAVVLGLVCWPALHRRSPLISWTLGAAALARWILIATRSDWHGGFCVGPRYLVLLLPFLLVPIGVAVGEWIRRGNRRFVPWLTAALILCVAQQAAFSLGEIFIFLHRVKFQAERMQVDIFSGDRIYLDWQWSPLFRLLEGRRGPFLLQGVDLSNTLLWLLLTVVLALPIVVGAKVLDRRMASSRAL